MTSNDRDLDGLVAINDPLLRPLIVSDSDEERSAALEAILTEHAVPLVQKIVRQQSSRDRLFRAQDAEDIASSVVLRLLRKLQRVPFDREEAITRVTDFAAVTTFNAIHDFQRHQFPEWTRLKQRVRYALARDPRFRTWSSPAGLACALASAPIDAEPGPPPFSWSCRADASEPDAIEALLAAAGRPLLVDHVVDSLAEALKIIDMQTSSAASDVVDQQACQATQLETRHRLAALWRETCALPPSQRVALLLNLRDGDGSSAIALFALMGIASLDEVAAAIELPLPRLAKLWSSLPVDDLTIASILGVSRQKVINLRSSARQRLARRLRKW